jgi:hypothetical protein
MFSEAWLTHLQQRLNADPEMAVIGDWFTVSISLSCDEERRVLRFERGRLVQTILTPKLDAPCAFGFRASADIWRRFFSDPPEPLYHDVFAMLMRVPGFVLEGDTLVAMQHARALHRDGVMRRHPCDVLVLEAIDCEAVQSVNDRTRHRSVPELEIEGSSYRVFFEEAGEGIPLLCLHTAGADSRQYRHLMTDEAITKHFRVIRVRPAVPRPLESARSVVAREIPAHDQGVSRLHPRRVAGARTRSPGRRRLLDGRRDRPQAGGRLSAGAARDHRARELSVCSGSLHDFLHHPAIHGGELAASYTYGLCAPQSPESSARENWWYYSQAGPGVYAGDVHFYSIDWDGREAIKTIDTSVCKVSLLTGEYDYSCTPDMTRQVAAAIPGARLVIMKGIGHFR